MPTSLLNLVYSRSPKFQGLWVSVCGHGGGGVFLDVGGEGIKPGGHHVYDVVIISLLIGFSHAMATIRNGFQNSFIRKNQSLTIVHVWCAFCKFSSFCLVEFLIFSKSHMKNLHVESLIYLTMALLIVNRNIWSKVVF